MSSIATGTLIWDQPMYEWKEANIVSVNQTYREGISPISICNIFIAVTSLLFIIFGVSLICALVNPSYFLDWGSAFIGSIGSIGLAIIGWFSRRQL